MPYSHPITHYQHSNYIETVDLAWSAVTIDPDARRARELALFAPVHSFNWVAEVSRHTTRARVSAPGFHFDKGYKPGTLND